MIRMVEFVRMSRPDVMLIGFLTYLSGVRLVRPVCLSDVLEAMAVALISTNFIYTLNAITDRKIDSINAPQRSLPSGRMDVAVARRYAWMLGVGSLILPWCFAMRSPIAVVLLLCLPALGLVYSLPPFHLKRCPWLAVLATSVGLVIPISVGYLMNAPVWGQYRLLLILLFGLCLAVVPLKDVEDASGDAAYGIHNLYMRYGNTLLIGAAVGVSSILGFALLVPMVAPTRRIIICLSIVILGGMLVSVRRPACMYRRVIAAALLAVLVLHAI